MFCLFLFVLFCWVILRIVGRGIAWPYYCRNQKCPLMLMVRSVDGVIFMFKMPRAPGDTVLNPSRTESIFSLQSHIDQMVLCEVWFRPLNWQFFLFYLESKVAVALFLKERSCFCGCYQQAFQYYVAGNVFVKLLGTEDPPLNTKYYFCILI